MLAPASAAVASPAACKPSVEQAWVRAAPPGATMLAGYARVRNGCERPLVITGAKSPDFVMVMVHETRIEGGVSRMRKTARSPLPAKGELLLAPGGRHLMLMHPRRALPAGTVLRIELLLAGGGSIPAEFTVRRDAPK